MSGLLSRSPKPKDQLPALISAFEFETQAVITRTAPYSDRAILHWVSIIIVVLLVLLTVLPLDEVVTGTGEVVPTQGSYFVQPLGTAIIKSVAVKVGDVVRKGQVLAVLDPTFAGADQAQLINKQASDAAVVARLEAEQAGVPFVPKSHDRYQMLALADWRERQAEYRQGIANLDGQIASTGETGTRARLDAKNYAQDVSITSNLEQRMIELEHSGYGATIKTLSAQQARVDSTRQLQEAQSQAVQSTHDLAALRAQREVYITKWRDDLATALVQARNDLNQSTQDLVKANLTRQLTTLTAPSDSVVLKIAPTSAGAVVNPAPGAITPMQPPLFTLTPVSGTLEADVDIPAQDVGFVRRGDKARIKLDAFRYVAHGTADGVVKSISEGSFTTDENGQPAAPYFKVRVAITKVALRGVPKDYRLVPGMTLTGDVLVGHRTVMSYLVESGLRTAYEAMREP